MEALADGPWTRLGIILRRAAGLVPSADEELAWTALPLKAQLYVAAVMVAGAAAIIAFFPRTFAEPGLLVLLIASACITSLWKVNLPITKRSGATLSVSYAANLMALLLLGTRQALLVALAGVWTQCTYKVKQPYPLYRTAFSLAAEALTIIASGMMYQQIGGPVAPADTIGLAKPLVAAISTYFVVNTSLVAAAVALTTNRSIRQAWREDFLWSGASYMVAGSAGAMAAVVVARGEHWKAVLLIAPVYLTYRTYELFVGRLEDQARHMAEIRQLHQGTVEALMKAREAERAEQAARMTAERANRLKDEFLAIVSHELRTPLNSILGWADMLRRGRLQEQQRARAFQAIYEGARRQAQLIDDLLDVSRIMSGKLRLELTAVDLGQIVRDVVQAMQPVADGRHLRVDCDAEAGLGFIEGDGSRLQQVMSNLLSNALKFTPGGGTVGVRLRRVEGRIELVVSDTGQGIPDDFLPWVFEPFRQADASTTRVHGGLGLGLSIVKHIVEAHHGTVRAESDGPGRGATFIVTFPIDPVYGDGPGGALVLRRDRRAVDLPSLEGLTVLVVDDDLESRQVIAECLSVQQAEVQTAASAAEAYEMLELKRIDVLLADIAMPGEDGYAFMRRIRAGEIPEATAIPAAALTAFAREEDRQLALSAGFQMHLAKPIAPRAVVTAVANLARLKTVGVR
jgi:signal transduction histidine kinase/CheY-like chemotaxis protein